jgi:hypothetical protein
MVSLPSSCLSDEDGEDDDGDTKIADEGVDGDQQVEDGLDEDGIKHL